MNTSLSWIKMYVPDLDVTAQEYTDAMTLTGTKVEITYNLMRTMIAAFAFILPFSLVRQMIKDKFRLQCDESGKDGGWAADFGGILAGLSVSMSGNLHYITQPSQLISLNKA